MNDALSKEIMKKKNQKNHTHKIKKKRKIKSKKKTDRKKYLKN